MKNHNEMQTESQTSSDEWKLTSRKTKSGLTPSMAPHNAQDHHPLLLTDLDKIGVTNPHMTSRERLDASSAYWRERYRMIRAGRAPKGVIPQPVGSCPQCADAGWYMRGRELTKCECGYAGPSPAQKRLNRELDALSHKTFENFVLERAYRDAPERSAGFQRQMVGVTYRKATTWSQKPAGWLYVYGDPGCGKSHMAAAISNVLSASGWEVIYRSVPAMIDYMRDAMKSGSLESVYDMIERADCVVFDDIGAESQTDWAQAVLFRLLDSRVDKPTVITSNLDVHEHKYHARILDRLGASTRAWIAATSYRELKRGED
jgi:DNA replication protein DnaC